VTLYEQLGLEFAEKALESLAEELGEAWDQLPAQAKGDIRAALYDRGRLELLKAAGQDVQEELWIVDATIASWAWVGSDRVRSAVESTLQEIGSQLLRILLAALVA
jgi:hypothetical protein